MINNTMNQALTIPTVDLTLSEPSVVTAYGTHTCKNHKPIFCITTFTVYASVTDAANAIGVKVSTLSHALTRKSHACQGMKFCFVSEMPTHFEEIAEAGRKLLSKANAYDTIIAERERIRKAKEDREIHKAKYEELLKAAKEEARLLAEAEEIIANGKEVI